MYRQSSSKYALFCTLVILPAAQVAAETLWAVDGGTVHVTFDEQMLAEYGVTVQFGSAAALKQKSRLAISVDSTLHLIEERGALQAPSAGDMVLADAFALQSSAGTRPVGRLTIGQADDPDGAWVVRDGATVLFELHDLKTAFDPPAGLLLMEAASLVISPELAAALGDTHLAGQQVGSIAVEASLSFQSGDAPPSADQLFQDAVMAGLRTTCGHAGADVIVQGLTGVTNYTSSGGIEAFAVGTNSCNIGDTPLKWVASNNQHPVIGQSMFRLKNGRYEQIGISWLKHGFEALADDLCGCNCQDPGTGSLLGVGCTDPYTSGLNGDQPRLGPHFEVNPHTGFYVYPHTAQGQSGNSIYKRLQVPISELDPAQNGGGTYFVEGLYVTADDAAANNQDNNASYRQVAISGSGSAWSGSVTGMPTTQLEQPGIRAWADTDPGVTETDVRIPGEGLVLLAAKATDLGGGWYHYEYAIENLNSDRAVGAVSVPLDPATTTSNVGFHDVAYHSGEPFDGTDWANAVGGGEIRWSTTPYATNVNANALRFGTLYNFRFDANRPPAATLIRLEMFKPGTPGHVLAATIGPDPGVLDCNSNGVDDLADISGGTSSDCNTNHAPDECEEFPPTGLGTEIVASGFDSPVGVYSPPGDFNRLFVLEQNTGLIRIISGGSILPTPFLNLSTLISNGGERGLLGLAFDPDYASNGFFYVDYTNTSGNTVIARYTVSGSPNVANAGSAVILKTITQDFANHNGGALAFGPDGFLYVAMGDGGSGGDPNNRAQNINSLLGKILRLDVDNAPTYVAAGNPFIDTNGADEIWAYGVRNPWRITFDRQTGDLYIADVGQGAWEEIDVQPAGSTGGENYGWRCYEGDAAYNTSGCAAAGTMTFPVLSYNHGGGACSITGGYVYRGCAIPDLRGTYFFADYCANFVRSMRYRPGDAIPPAWVDRTAELGPFNGSIVSFGEDAAGEMYIVTSGGVIYRIIAQGTVGLCGDGLLDDGEECDDLNHDNGDGCDATCQLEGGSNDACADALNVCAGVYTGSTVNATVDGSTTCGTSNSTKDVWYHYVPATDGFASFSLCNGTSFDTVMSLHTGCPGNSGNSLTCADDTCGPSDGPSVIQLSVVAGESYYIRVSGFNLASGTFQLAIDGPPCAAINCGNGALDPGEECEPPGTQTCDEVCRSIPCDIELMADNFETDKGWTTSFAGAISGFWERGVPVNDPNWVYDPVSDGDGSGSCYLTGNALGNTDVDNGSVTLISPVIDMTAGNVTIEYSYFLYLTGTTDSLVVEINNNAGTGPWTEIARQTITPAMLATAGVTYTANMKVRFTAADTDPQGQVEAAIDAFRVTTPCIDCDSNGYDDSAEIAAGSAFDCNSNGVLDVCDIAGGTSADCDGGPVGSVAGGDLIVNTFCFGCHDTDGSGGPGFPGPNLRGKSRLFIRRKLTPPTDHPGGAHPEFTWQDYADLEAFLSDIGGRARPDLVPDECEVTTDCNSNGVADGCDLASHAEVDLNHSGVLDECEGLCATTIGDIDADCDVDLGDFAGVQRCYTGDGGGSVVYPAGCACIDADGDGDVDELDYAKVAGVLLGPASPAQGCVP
jgi:cysteine-rich repeat protein